MEYEHWKNKKTGVIYTVIDEVINTTNVRNGEQMILYCDEAKQLVFVREKTEFYAKFEKV